MSAQAQASYVAVPRTAQAQAQASYVAGSPVPLPLPPLPSVLQAASAFIEQSGAFSAPGRYSIS